MISVERLMELRTAINPVWNSEDYKDLKHYLSHSIPYEVYEKLYEVLLPLIESLEEKGIYSEETHHIRNVLATLSGYQVLAYV